MLKARAADRLLFGLSARNIEMLMNGYPIEIQLEQVGGPADTIVIFYGKTEQDMKDALESAGIEIPDAPG